jgi:serine/threonine protein kinase
MWALGIIIFQMIGGYHPYSDIPCKYSANKINYDNRYWENISEDGKNFIDNLLVCDPYDRMSASNALSHQWLCV